MDERSLAYPSPAKLDEERGGACFACYRGVVYIGHMVEDRETGEEVELFLSRPCRRCANSR